MKNPEDSPPAPAGFPSDPPWLHRVSANQLRAVPYPRCADTCALFVKLAAGECPDTCRWKFDEEGRPIPELAGRLRRWCARTMDVLLVFLVMAPAAVALDLARPDLVEDTPTPIRTAVVVAAYYLIFGLVNGWLLRSRGQTIGKWILGIRIMRTDHRPISFRRLLLLREIVLGAPQALPLIGGLVQFVDGVFILGSDRQCLHDMLADTKVVRIPPRRYPGRNPPQLPIPTPS